MKSSIESNDISNYEINLTYDKLSKYAITKEDL